MISATFAAIKFWKKIINSQKPIKSSSNTKSATPVRPTVRTVTDEEREMYNIRNLVDMGFPVIIFTLYIYSVYY